VTLLIDVQLRKRTAAYMPAVPICSTSRYVCVCIEKFVSVVCSQLNHSVCVCACMVSSVKCACANARESEGACLCAYAFVRCTDMVFVRMCIVQFPEDYPQQPP